MSDKFGMPTIQSTGEYMDKPAEQNPRANTQQEKLDNVAAKALDAVFHDRPEYFKESVTPEYVIDWVARYARFEDPHIHTPLFTHSPDSARELERLKEVLAQTETDLLEQQRMRIEAQRKAQELESECRAQVKLWHDSESLIASYRVRVEQLEQRIADQAKRYLTLDARHTEAMAALIRSCKGTSP